MNPVPVPDNEDQRLARLKDLFILNSAPEPLFDSITRAAAQVCGVPIALITLIDADRQWFKSTYGLANATETPRDQAFCAHTILTDELLEVPDATQDPRFNENPFVTGEPNIRFYAGVPLVLPAGERVGSLCVVDSQVHTLGPDQAETLRSLATIATQALTLRRDLINRALVAQSAYEADLTARAAETDDLYENAPCGYHSLDAAGRFVRVNRTMLRWLGTTRGLAVGRMKMTDFFNDAGKQLFRQNFPRLVSEGHLEDLEFDLISKAGTVRRLIASATVVRDHRGKFLMTRTVSYDISALQETREALRRVTEEQDAILNTELVGILKLSERRIVWANAGAEHLLGYARGELQDRPTRILHLDDEAHRRYGVETYSTLEAGLAYRTQLEMVKKNGERFWVDMSITTLPGATAEPLVMLLDITPLKRAERVRLRSVELEAENRQLAEANRLKMMFLSNMSHELLTPLNAVIGYAQLLQRGKVPPDSPKFQGYLSHISTSGKQLLDLVGTVLNYARLESGKMQFTSETVDPRRLIDEVVEIHEADIAARGLSIDVSVGDVERIVTDGLRLSQMISHYVSNAIKFSREGGHIDIRATLEGNDKLRIVVQDDGIGIAEPDMDKLFIPFQQLSEGSGRSHGGAGMGLALTHLLCEAQGGTVGAASKPGEGSAFWLMLPVQVRRADAA